VLEAQISPSCKLICLTIATYVNAVGGAAWPSRETLMANTGLGHSTFAKAMREAVEAGLLDLQRQRLKNGHLGRYRYHPRYPDDTQAVHKVAPERAGIECPEEEANQVQNMEVATSRIWNTSNTPIEGTILPSGGGAARPRSPSKRAPKPETPQATFKDGKVTLPPELRAEWAPKFGSEEKLDRVLGMIVGKMQPYSARKVSAHNQVMGWLHVKLDDHLRDAKREASFETKYGSVNGNYMPQDQVEAVLRSLQQEGQI
jgi:hypothetical protein